MLPDTYSATLFVMMKGEFNLTVEITHFSVTGKKLAIECTPSWANSQISKFVLIDKCKVMQMYRIIVIN